MGFSSARSSAAGAGWRPAQRRRGRYMR
jgi:hypothetical protein